jgi:hypothetical protein
MNHPTSALRVTDHPSQAHFPSAPTILFSPSVIPSPPTNPLSPRLPNATSHSVPRRRLARRHPALPRPTPTTRATPSPSPPSSPTIRPAPRCNPLRLPPSTPVDPDYLRRDRPRSLHCDCPRPFRPPDTDDPRLAFAATIRLVPSRSTSTIHAASHPAHPLPTIPPPALSPRSAPTNRP